jgi:sigma-E factor negative regulatory protein RseC
MQACCLFHAKETGLEQQVTVIAIEGNEAIVSGRRATSCADCAGKESCSTLGSWKDRVVEMRVKNLIHAHIGDEVLLELPDAILMRIAFRLYGLPMLAFLFSGLIVRRLALFAAWPLPEVWAAVAGLLGVLVTYSWILYRSKDAASNSLKARMVRVIQPASQFPIKVINE